MRSIENKPTKKGIASFDFFCIGFGAIVGVGWAVSINSWMQSSGGPLPAATGYLLALIIMIPVALCYCELCPMLPVSGGGMAYAFRAFGDRIAFVSGWAAFGAFVTIIPWEAIYVVDILSILFPVLKAGTPLYTLAGADIYIGHIAVGTAISVVLFLINRKGVASSAALQKVLCIALVGAGIIAMIIAGSNFDVANLQPYYENVGNASHNSFFGGAMSILASVPFFLAGFETIPQGMESAGGDKKRVGKTVVSTVVLSCLFYAMLLLTLGGAMPWTKFISFKSPAAALLFKEIYPGAIGTVLYGVILVGAVCGLLTTWNGFMMASSQILMAMARVSIVPFSLSKQHPVHGTPINALKVALAASLIGPFLGSGLIGSLTTFSAAGYVLSWAVTAFCLIKLRKTEPDTERPYKIPGGTKTAWFAGICMCVLFVMLFIPGQPVFMGIMATKLFLIWMLAGVGLYVLDARQRRQYSEIKRATFLFASMAGAETMPEASVWGDYDFGDYKVLSFNVPKDAPYCGQNLMELGWGMRQNIFILKIEHKDKLMLIPSGSTVISCGDHVFAVGLDRSIHRFEEFQDIGPKYTIDSLKNFMGLGDAEQQSPLTCVAIHTTGAESYCGKALNATNIQKDAHCMVVGIRRRAENVLNMPYATTVIKPGDTLWVLGADEDIEKMRGM